MSVVAVLTRCMRMIGGLLRPAYHPECHYMRGPGPACLKRAGKPVQPGG